MHRVRSVVLALLWSTSLLAQATGDVSVDFDLEGRRLRCSQTLRFTHTADEPLAAIRLQLPWNAWRERRLPAFVDVDGTRLDRLGAEAFGAIDILGATVSIDGAAAVELTADIVTGPAPGADERDRTLARIPLPDACQRGARVEVALTFESRPPRTLGLGGPGLAPDRTWFGFGWLPICLDVAEPLRLDVRMWMPERFEVGTSGIDAGVAHGGVGRVVRQFVADGADFAFVAGAGLQRHERTVGPWTSATAGAPPNGVRIVCLVRGGAVDPGGLERRFDAAAAMVRSAQARLGRFPHPTLTLVDPVIDAAASSHGGGLALHALRVLDVARATHARRPDPERAVLAAVASALAPHATPEQIDAIVTDAFVDLATRRPFVRTTTVGPLTFAASPGLCDGSPDLSALARLPLPEWIGDLVPTLRPTTARLDGAWLPASPLLDLLRTQPTAASPREVALREAPVRAWTETSRASPGSPGSPAIPTSAPALTPIPAPSPAATKSATTQTLRMLLQAQHRLTFAAWIG